MRKRHVALLVIVLAGLTAGGGALLLGDDPCDEITGSSRPGDLSERAEGAPFRIIKEDRWANGEGSWRLAIASTDEAVALQIEEGSAATFHRSSTCGPIAVLEALGVAPTQAYREGGRLVFGFARRDAALVELTYRSGRVQTFLPIQETRTRLYTFVIEVPCNSNIDLVGTLDTQGELIARVPLRGGTGLPTHCGTSPTLRDVP